MRKLIGVTFLIAVLASACTSRSGSVTVTDLEPGDPDRFTEALRRMRGKPVVANYWATWCTPCKEEMPRIVAAAKRYEDRVGFIGVNVEDDVELAARFARRYKMPFRSIADPRGEIRTDQHIRGLPVTQFYGADGELALVHQGEIETDQLEEKIEEVLRL